MWTNSQDNGDGSTAKGFPRRCGRYREWREWVGMDLEEEGQEVCGKVYLVGHWCVFKDGMWGKWGPLRG